MSSANITRDQAIARSQRAKALAYRVHIDVTGRDLADPERNFSSSTELDLNATGGAIELDLIADQLISATIDGEAIDISGFDGYRLSLPELAPGEHTISVQAVCRYSHSGEGLHRFVDPVDAKTYLYSQFETADARRMYATLEQPDQKASFTLSVECPASWTVFSNANATSIEPAGEGSKRWQHATTPVIPTYITALVAGEYHVVEAEITSDGRSIPARLGCRASMAKYLDAERILTTTQRGFEVFEAAFGVPYAFDSYDQIFVPEFNFGAMENAGCITFRDEYLFRSRVTSRELEARDNTILHELAHMWFGDLVTMKWWDDLWLNESFAEWASHFAADEIAKQYGTGANPWASFSNERKAWAYLQDQLSTTHPIAADMSDLEKVEQNFDGITYAKGASVLKLLVSFVGKNAFLTGVGNYFRKHAFSNTTLADLLVELEAASGRELSWFSGQWLETAGVNTLQPKFEVNEQGRFTRFAVQQTATAAHPTLRTHRIGIGIYDFQAGVLARVNYIEADISGEYTEIPALLDAPRGAVILLNDGDLSYTKVRFDPDSATALISGIDQLHDPLSRAVVWASFWDSVRDAEIPPQDFVQLALTGLASETDMTAVTTICNQIAICSRRFMAPELREAANQQLVSGFARLLKTCEPGSDKQLIVAKGLIGAASSQAAITLIRGWLIDEEVPAGLVIDTDLRWVIVASLARLGAIGLQEIETELARDNTNAGAEKAAGARASLPDETQKQLAWGLATVDPDVPNETHRRIAGGFWQYHQEDQLRPYVDRYFEVAALISDRQAGWADRGYAAIDTVLRWLYPEPLVDEQLVARTKAWLAESERSEQVKRAVNERLDEAERALRVQARSREATAS